MQFFEIEHNSHKIGDEFLFVFMRKNKTITKVFEKNTIFAGRNKLKDEHSLILEETLKAKKNINYLDLCLKKPFFFF